MSLFGGLGDPRDIDAAVRLRLGRSLAYILRKAKGRLDIDTVRVDAALQNIRTRKQDPGVFARYYDLISAITSNRIAEANVLLEEIVVLAEGPAASFMIVPYARQRLGPDYERFPRLIFAEYSQTNPMHSPSDFQSVASARMLEEAIEIISRVDPVIHGEIGALLRRIYLATANKDPAAKRFGGVTSFLVWGGSFINIDFYRTRWDAVQFLVHEITHGLLFGLSFDEPLVQNAPDESYRSPLRADDRPMDGVFHATLVCARLADFNRAWLDSGLTKGADRESSKKAVADNLRFFGDGVDVINKHGRLSEQGRQLVERSCIGLLEFE